MERQFIFKSMAGWCLLYYMQLVYLEVVYEPILFPLSRREKEIVAAGYQRLAAARDTYARLAS